VFEYRDFSEVGPLAGRDDRSSFRASLSTYAADGWRVAGGRSGVPAGSDIDAVEPQFVVILVRTTQAANDPA
jgi:hypothetical protein